MDEKTKSCVTKQYTIILTNTQVARTSTKHKSNHGNITSLTLRLSTQHQNTNKKKARTIKIESTKTVNLFLKNINLRK